MARCSVGIDRAIPPIAATSFIHRSDIIETELGRLHFGDQASGVRPDLIDPPMSSGVNRTTAISTSVDTIQLLDEVCQIVQSRIIIAANNEELLKFPDDSGGFR